jgi:hypothetical protein
MASLYSSCLKSLKEAGKAIEVKVAKADGKRGWILRVNGFYGIESQSFYGIDNDTFALIMVAGWYTLFVM